jgi:hypothetical protein
MSTTAELPRAALVFSCDRDNALARSELFARSKMFEAPVAVSRAGTWPLVMRTDYVGADGIFVPLLVVYTDNMGARGFIDLVTALPKDIALVHCGGAASQDLALGSVASVIKAREYNVLAAMDDAEYTGGDTSSFGAYPTCAPTQRAALAMSGGIPCVAHAVSTGGCVVRSARVYERAAARVGAPSLLDMQSYAFYDTFKTCAAPVLAVRGIWNRADAEKDKDEAVWREPTMRLAVLVALHAALLLSDGTTFVGGTPSGGPKENDCAHALLLARIREQTKNLEKMRAVPAPPLVLAADEAAAASDQAIVALCEKTQGLRDNIAKMTRTISEMTRDADACVAEMEVLLAKRARREI